MIRRLFLGVLCFWVLALGQGTVCNSARGETCNRLVAIVNDDVITLHELDKKIKALTGVDAETIRRRNPPEYQKVREKVLDLIIDDRIAQKRINELGIEIYEKEIDEAIQKIMEDNQWNRKELLAMLQSRGLRMDEYRKTVKEDLQKQRLINYEVKSKIIIREEQIETYYQEHKERFQRKQGVELASIFLPKNASNNAGSSNKVQEKAEKILEALRNGADFSTMARQHSEGPGARQGGYLGRFDPSQLDPVIRRSIEETPEGEISDLIITANGIQIIRVISKGGSGVQPLERARPTIRRILMNEEIDRRYAAWIQELRKETYTKILF
jgi:peptidyl-prolyl cis-trans isomerase SurA